MLGFVVLFHAGNQLDEGFDLLHLVGIRHADDAAHLHEFVGVQNVLNLGGVDVVAGGDDHPLGSAAEIHEALAVHGAEVAGADPSQAVGVVL